MGASKRLVNWPAPHREMAGMEFEPIAERMGMPVHDAVEALLPAGAIHFAMDEADVRRLLAFPHTMVCFRPEADVRFSVPRCAGNRKSTTQDGAFAYRMRW